MTSISDAFDHRHNHIIKKLGNLSKKLFIVKRIILAFDGPHYSDGAFEFVRRLNEYQPVFVTGIFLPHVDFNTAWTYSYSNAATWLPLIEEYSTELLNTSISRFEQACKHYGIAFKVCSKHLDFSIPELQKETRFADLMLLGSERFYQNLGVASPNEYLRMAIHQSECPVIVIPEKFKFPHSVVLAYDGSDDATFAIKSFACLMPELTSLHTVLVYATNKDAAIPESNNIQDLCSSHFPNLTLQVLGAKPTKYFGTWINDIKNPLLVCGAFGRTALSQLFKSSFITEVISDHNIPIFIAHR
ncbi:hypothetical protein SAMN05444266_109250 [Chitinophaga jiangningensis]|uniref:Nucleotide-binding universal stress protein, UspA family n=1 Tax=Chitinophaga jiangningensis TaxID=1419482 RepID=A0A1M7KCE0_9BACT|nr:hypothetical protein [Chitinophaga jiangningensis]SHM62941.1 hypothetical protein SAMN05444266_109250 [Chitinophaga jiangningensis]